MRGPLFQRLFCGALFCTLASVAAAGATTDQDRKTHAAKSQVIIVNGTSVIVIRNGRAQTRTIRRTATSQIHIPKAAPAPKDTPVAKGDAGSCIALVRDTSGSYLTPYYRARNSCPRRVRLWVFDTSRQQWKDSIIVEPREDATASDYDGISVGAGQVVAACTMSGDTNPPGCFPKVSGGLYAITTNNVILH